MTRNIVFLTFLLFLLQGCRITSQGLSGRITDAVSGQPLSGIPVTQRLMLPVYTIDPGGGSHEKEKLRREVLTDREGRFSFEPFRESRNLLAGQEGEVWMTINTWHGQEKGAVGLRFFPKDAGMYSSEIGRVWGEGQISLIPIVPNLASCQGNRDCVSLNRYFGEECAGQAEGSPFCDNFSSHGGRRFSPSPPDPRTRPFTKSVGTIDIELLPIPGGEFMMGTDEKRLTPGMSGDDRYPAHRIILPGFFMAKTEVTVAQFRNFVESTGYITDAERAGVRGTLTWKAPGIPQDEFHPVVNVSWNDAVAFCRWADVRLPTEAEWEYAAGGGTDYLVWSGTSNDEALSDYAWLSKGIETATHPVGQLLPNSFGLRDMSGNVSEWCSDWYGSDYYASSPLNNPAGPRSGKRRVVRGIRAYGGSVTLRSSHSPDRWEIDRGFRVAMDHEINRP